MPNDDGFLWYKDRGKVKLGDVFRYFITYEKSNDSEECKIYLRLKNLEKASMRTIHMINGPLILYAHVVPHNFNHKTAFVAANSKQSKEVVFKNAIKPSRTFNVELFLNENSYYKQSKNGNPLYRWNLDVISQIVIGSKCFVQYELTIGNNFQKLRHLNTNLLQRTLNTENNQAKIAKEFAEMELNHSINSALEVDKFGTESLWSTPPKDKSRPVHLIILTHGIFSNVTADMIYLKDRLEVTTTENIIVRGYSGNTGKSDAGIEKLGRRQANYIIKLIEELIEDHIVIGRLSFVAHSLGGLVHLYALKEVSRLKGDDFFRKRDIELYNLICLATPLLGVISELNLCFTFFLDLGVFGKTGRDLALSRKFAFFKNKHANYERRRNSFKPVLEVLPEDPLHLILTQFKHLTLYANAVNDGIVPLRTSSLLYLDYEALSRVGQIIQKENFYGSNQKAEKSISNVNSLEDNTVMQVPSDEKERKAHKARNKKPPILKMRKASKSRQFILSKINTKGIDIKSEDSEYSSSDLSPSDLKKEESFLPNHPMEDASTYGSSRLDIDIFPRSTSAVQSFFNVLLCPIPDQEYIVNPESRAWTIFHDKYYRITDCSTQSDQPDVEKMLSSLEKHDPIRKYHSWKLKKQVKISRKYHTPDLCWRKVLVSLPPDAHNNIIVRRRFSNGFGWPIIDHICSELFNPYQPREDTDVDNEHPTKTGKEKETEEIYKNSAAQNERINPNGKMNVT